MPEGFVYPNEVEIQWSILIVLYPFITGLVAGAFVVSSLYHVFNVKALKPVASMSLLVALSFLLVAPLALQAHLGRPERGFQIFLTPNPTSAMAGFGYIWLFYLILVTVEVWLVFRPDIVFYARTARGIKRLVCGLATLGVTEISEEDRRVDEKLIKVLAGVGIPAAAMLHGYVGFLFGAIKANPWWSTPLMPVIFLMSAIVSGMALLIVMYIVISRLRGKAVDHDCVRTLAAWLLGFLVIDLAIEGLEVLSMAYEAEESWDAVSLLMTKQIPITYFGVQLFLGSLIPLAILSYLALSSRMKAQSFTRVVFLAASLVVVGVFAMRWNVVIGGQEISKSLRGFVTYTPPIGGREGIAAAALFLMLPFYIFSTLVSIIPPWDRPKLEDVITWPEPDTVGTAAWETASALQGDGWDRGVR
jgi:Ni/Fe-hydrogenase subunit HybB-like protein